MQQGKTPEHAEGKEGKGNTQLPTPTIPLPLTLTLIHTVLQYCTSVLTIIYVHHYLPHHK